MESVELGLDDMFEEREVDEDEAVGQGMMDNEARDGDDARDENGDLQSQAVTNARDRSAGAAKKVIKNPQPKLDAIRLNSDRGFPALRKIFDDVKFKGKGHEVSDFLLMMRTMEHWAHRLFPKMTFDEVIDRCERLGNKAQVKTVVRKIRMGMPVLDDDFVDRRSDEEDDNGEENQAREQADATQFPDSEDEIDNLLRDAGAAARMDDDDDDSPVRVRPSQGPPASQAPPRSPQSEQVARSPPKSPVFGNEQRERMERNKRLAMEKREARLRAQEKAAAADSQLENGGSQPATGADDSTSLPVDPDVTTSLPAAAAQHPADSTQPPVASNSQNGDDSMVDDDILKELEDDFEFDENSVRETEATHSQSFTESLKLKTGEGESRADESEVMNEKTKRNLDLSPRKDTEVEKVNEENFTPSCSEPTLNLNLDDDSDEVSQTMRKKSKEQRVNLSPKIDTELEKTDETMNPDSESVGLDLNLDGDSEMAENRGSQTDLSPAQTETVAPSVDKDGRCVNTEAEEDGMRLCLDADSSPPRAGELNENKDDDDQTMEVDE